MGTTTEVMHEQVIFFDGVCNLCNSSVNFVIDHDKRGRFKFASLQSAYARAKLADFGIKSQELESIILIKGGVVCRKSDAVLEIARGLGGGWSVFYAFRILPLAVRDLIYDFVAKRRYKWFGRRDLCRVPAPELQERFLDS